MTDCIFCQREKIKSPIMQHSERVISFVPLNPVTEGHRIFVSTKHVTDFFDDPDTYAEVSRVVALYARSFEDYNVITSKGSRATQSVFHLHVHLVPRRENDGLKLPWTDQKKS